MNEKEYMRRRNFFTAYVKNVIAKRNSEALSAISTIESFERESKSKATKALDIGIADCLLDAEMLPKEMVFEIDEWMRKNEAITIAELRILRSKRYKQLIKKGLIDSDDDFEYAKNLIDSDSILITADAAVRLGDMIASYEARCRSS